MAGSPKKRARLQAAAEVRRVEEARLAEDTRALLRRPVAFATQALGFPLYDGRDGGPDWQARLLCRLEGEQMDMIAGVTPNGAGKSQIIIPSAAFYWLAIYAQGMVRITTSSHRQLVSQIYPALTRLRDRLPGWEFKTSPHIHITSPTGGTIEAFVTKEGGRIEGEHGSFPNNPLLWIADECKTISADIFEGIDRCTWQKKMYLSSPGKALGTFYECFRKNRERWTCVQAGLKDCPHVPQSRIDYVIAEWGENHPYTRSTLYGEFMSDDGEHRYVFDLQDVQDLLESPPEPRDGARVAACDFAGPGDESVLALRLGNKVEVLDAWRSADMMASVGRFITLFRKHGLSANEILGDADGMGFGFIGALKDAGWPIRSFHGGSAPRDGDHFKNRGTECWHETAAAVRRREIILPTDDKLISQLTGRRCKEDGRGRTWMEGKDEMKARGLASPDRADAVCMAVCGIKTAPHQDRTFGLDLGALMETLSHNTDSSALAGMDVGI